MRKTTLLATVLLTVLTLTILTPVVKAAGFTWDGLTYVEGQYIKYPHPDRNVYYISPFHSWSMNGWKLTHHQVEQAESQLIVRTAPVLCAAFGAVLGAAVGGGYGAAFFTVIGLALGLYITYVADSLFLDEYNCIWWWTSIKFMDQLSAWAPTIAYYSTRSQVIAIQIVLNLIDEYGYLRVGKVTFLDNVNPTWCQTDLNYDGIVDVDDIQIVCAAYGSYPGYPTWNPNADLDGNNLVDIDDVMTVANDYGKYSPVWPLHIT